MFNTHKYSGTPDKADTWLIQTLATTDSGLKLGPTPYISLKLTRLIRTFRNKDNFSWFQLRCAYEQGLAVPYFPWPRREQFSVKTYVSSNSW